MKLTELYCMFAYALHFYLQYYSSRCHGLRLSVLNKETTYSLSKYRPTPIVSFCFVM